MTVGGNVLLRPGSLVRLKLAARTCVRMGDDLWTSRVGLCAASGRLVDNMSSTVDSFCTGGHRSTRNCTSDGIASRCCLWMALASVANHTLVVWPSRTSFEACSVPSACRSPVSTSLSDEGGGSTGLGLFWQERTRTYARQTRLAKCEASGVLGECGAVACGEAVP